MMRRHVIPLAPTCVALATLALAAALACSGPSSNQTFVPTFPDPAMYPLVSDALELHCGTLDCHGSIARNMRMYGVNGLRADPRELLGTTDVEYQDNYEAIVSIQPEALTDIVKSRGNGFDKWIVVTKGTNAEYHKGGERMKKGDVTYNCLKSWVLGAVDMDACGMSAGVVTPGDDTP
jgi:hypothetical protein